MFVDNFKINEVIMKSLKSIKHINNYWLAQELTKVLKYKNGFDKLKNRFKIKQ